MTSLAASALQVAKKAAQEAQIGQKDPARFPAWPHIKHLLNFAAAHDDRAMFAKVLCYPPLGQATVVAAGKTSVLFHVVLEVAREADKSWEVQLWHGCEENWTASRFEEMQGGADILSINEAKSSTKKIYFTLQIPKPTSTNTETKFTIRFRNAASTEWKWANDQFLVSDGSIYWQPEAVPQQDLPFYITGTDPAVKFEKRTAQTSDTLLWELSCPVDKARGEDSSFTDYKLGLATNFTRWFATCRLMTTWLQPKHGKHKFFPDDTNAVSIAFLRHDGLSVVVLGLSGIDDTAVQFRNDKDGNVVVKVRNDAEHAGSGKVLVAVAASFEVANAAVMYHARRVSVAAQQGETALEQRIQALDLGLDVEEVEPLWLQEWYDGFGYCTWNSLGQQLTEQAILDALAQFRKDDIGLTTLIIDDNWQSLDNEGQNQGQRGMTRFEADAKAFPDGLRGLVRKIRMENPSIQRIAVWHTMLGYWGAISPDGEIAKKYKTVKARNPGGLDWTCIAAEDIHRFYSDFFRFLQECGVDGVKTDSQNSLDDLQHAPNRRTMIKEYQDAWTIAGLRYLRARQIGCGSQCPVIMFHSMIKTTTPRIVVRNSDDFFPNNPGSHPWHIFCNAHNVTFMQHLNILPDWDMFQTDHEWAYYHAAARCISGGPVYITDSPAKHDKALIAQMTGITPRGTAVILRPSRLGKASQVYNSYAEPRLLKINTYHGRAQTGSSIVGVFNVSQAPLAELVSLMDFSGTEQGFYVIRSHIQEKSSLPMAREQEHAFVQIDLDVKGYDILTAFPLKKFTVARGDVHVANLGLLGKMSGAAAIVSTQLYSTNDEDTISKSPDVSATPAPFKKRATIWTSLKTLGIWGVWIDNLPEMSLENDFFGLLYGKPVPLEYVRVSSTDERVLEMDLERAWKDGQYSMTWSNEVVVQLLIR